MTDDGLTARRQALFLAICAAAIVFCLSYAAPAVYELRLFWYYPLEHRWAFKLKPTGLAMDWFGRNGLSIVLATPVGFITAWATRRLRPLSTRTLGLIIAWTATAALLTMSLFAYNLAFRDPKPLPLPEWYEPR